MEVLTGYLKERRVVSLVWANVFSFILLIAAVPVFIVPYYYIWHGFPLMDIFRPEKILYIPAALILGVILHELIHGATWAMFAENGFNSIKFGFFAKYLTPYCHCKEALKFYPYVIGAVMPAIVLGIIPAVLAMVLGRPALLMFGIIFICSASGDFLVVYAIRKYGKNALIKDDPLAAGCYIYKKIE